MKMVSRNTLNTENIPRIAANKYSRLEVLFSDSWHSVGKTLQAKFKANETLIKYKKRKENILPENYSNACCI